ncbi:MAG: hydroxyacid dehydrogenase [Anaerolineae bacterium]|nr:hydroxyacid dehydrogenase [Anaerolineae bacterium]
MMKVLICDSVAQSTISVLQDAGIEVDYRPQITAEELVRDAAQYDGMVVRSRTRVPKEVIDAADSLKIIVRGGVGLDNIDVPYAQAKGISVRNTPKASSNSVAELALGYMLALARRIPQASASMAAGEWKKKQLSGSEIAGKTLGLIGFGNIGSLLGQKAAALGMDVIFYDVITPPPMDYARQVSLEEVLRESDFVSLHIPKVPATTNLINAETLAQMKDGVYIINCARGGVIDEDALYDALDSGKVAGAALDVYADEKVNPGNARLYQLRDKDGFHKVIGSPHVGASTVEGQERVGGEVADILIEYYKENF